MPPDRFTACALVAGRLNRLLARWGAATTCYEAAERAARAHDDAVSALRSRLGRAGVARGRGNLPAARAIAESVQQEAGTRQLPEVEAMAYADIAAALSQLGSPVEALGADYRAFRLTQDPAQRIRALGNIGIDLIQLGAHEAARTAFTLVVRSNAKALVRVNALLELMGLESTLGNQTGFERQRRAADELRDLMPPTMEVDFLFKTASGLARFGQRGQARGLLTQALAIAERRSLHAWYFRIEQALREHEQCTEQLPREAATTSLGESPVVREVAAGLQEYAGFSS
jgi:tetratricopeptide (TPR) repeat protein